MKKNAGWIITIVVLSVMLVFSLVAGAAGTLFMPASSEVSAPQGEPVVAPTIVEVEPTDTPAPTATPGPCSPESMPSQVARVHSLTREFEDTAQLLTSTLLSESSIQLVQELQRIRRVAEDQVVPDCVADLKTYQVAHMNARIEVFGTALSFLNAYGPGGDQKALDELLTPLYAKAELAARQYENEYARLLGLPTAEMPAVQTFTPTP